MAVIGATQLEPVNILGSYVQGMELGRANRLAQQQQAAQIEAARQEAELRNYLSTADLESPEAQNQLLRFGAPGATLAKTLGEMRNADLTRQKTMTEIEAAGMKRQRDLLAAVNDQPTYDMWRRGALEAYKGVPGAEQLIPAEFSPETKERLLLTADQIVGRMPMPPEQEAQKTRISAAGAPKIQVLPSAKKFAETFGAKAAEQLDDLYTKAQSAEKALGLSARLKPLLNNPDFISGTLGNVRLEAAKALGLPGADDTQAYFAGIGGQVAEIIKNFGAGTGLSDADRKFAEKMAGGDIELTPAAIKKIVALNDEASKVVLNKYNTRRKDLSKKDTEVADYYPEVRVIVRTGTLNGRKVVQYQDGTTEYVD
jgi:hypothetical protein